MCTSCAKQVAYIGLTQWRPYLHNRVQISTSRVQNFKSVLSGVSYASWFWSARSRKKTASRRKNRNFRSWLFFGKQANEKACVAIEHSVRKHSQMRADELSMQKTHAGWPWRSPLQWRPRAAPFASSSFLSHHHRRRALFAFFPFRSPLFSFSRCISAWVSNFAIIMQPARPMMHLKSCCCGASRCRQRRK